MKSSIGYAILSLYCFANPYGLRERKKILLNPSLIYSSIISLKCPKLYFEVVINADTHSWLPHISLIIARFFSKMAWWFNSLFCKGRFVSCKYLGPSREVEIVQLCFFRYFTISSFSNVRLVQITNSNTFFLKRFCHSASSMIYFTISKFVDGSPPWNSILINGEGDWNMVFTTFFAVFFVMFAELSSIFLRATWQ